MFTLNILYFHSQRSSLSIFLSGFNRFLSSSLIFFILSINVLSSPQHFLWSLPVTLNLFIFTFNFFIFISLHSVIFIFSVFLLVLSVFYLHPKCFIFILCVFCLDYQSLLMVFIFSGYLFIRTKLVEVAYAALKASTFPVLFEVK